MDERSVCYLELENSSLYDCINCATLPPVWKLPLLENLELYKMRSLLYICSTESTEAKKSEHLTTFPSLRKFDLYYLNGLEGWHENDDKLAAFPKLEELTIEHCPKLKSIPFTPLLRKFSTYNLGGIKLLQISKMTMVASSELAITLFPSPTEPDAFRPPINVVQMEVEGFETVIPLEEDDEENCQKMALRHLDIKNINCFFSRGPSKLSLGFWKYFIFIKTLIIMWCSTLSYWPEQEFRSLKCLKRLSIRGCENFTYLKNVLPLAQMSRDYYLHRLENLHISECPKLEEVPNCSMSLKALNLRECSSLSKEGLSWINNFRDLKELSISYCMGLKSLPDDYPTSLVRLSITQCPGIESFSEGLQQQLLELKYLQILRCPVLVRRCGDGGDYQHLITNIPTKKIK